MLHKLDKKVGVLMAAHGISQRTLAKLSGVSRRTLGRIRDCATNPKEQTVVKLAQTFRVKPEVLSTCYLKDILANSPGLFCRSI